MNDLARITAADFLGVSSRSTQEEWLRVDLLAQRMRDVATAECPVQRGEIGIVHAHVADLREKLTGEAYFIDRDIFVEYVRSTLNPAREKEELSTCTPAVASHLYDVITSRRYRK